MATLTFGRCLVDSSKNCGALVGAEEHGLPKGVVHDADYDLVEHRAAPRDDVEMADSHGVVCAGAQHRLHRPVLLVVIMVTLVSP